MTIVPAVLSRLMQIVTSPFRLLALYTMVLDRLMQSVIRPRNASLAIVIVCAQQRRSCHYKKTGHNRKQRRTPKQSSSRTMLHTPLFLSSDCRRAPALTETHPQL